MIDFKIILVSSKRVVKSRYKGKIRHFLLNFFLEWTVFNVLVFLTSFELDFKWELFIVEMEFMSSLFNLFSKLLSVVMIWPKCEGHKNLFFLSFNTIYLVPVFISTLRYFPFFFSLQFFFIVRNIKVNPNVVKHRLGESLEAKYKNDPE